MNNVLKKFLIYFSLLVLFVNCKTTSVSNDITSELTQFETYHVEKLLKIAIEKGNPFLNKAKEVIIKRREQQLAQKILENKLMNYSHTWNINYIQNSIILYKDIVTSINLDLIKTLAFSPSTHVRQLSWILAAYFPSDKMRDLIDQIISIYVNKNAESQIISPYLAIAIEKNKVNSLYSFMKKALLEFQDEAYARTMISLNPMQASQDFLDYLSLATIEDLRQLNQKSINIYTAMLILQHQITYAPSPYSPKFNVLLLYSVSRNQLLSDLAITVIESLINTHKEQIAYLISQMQVWVQIAFIENINRRKNTVLISLLKTLQQITPHKEILAELENIN